MTISVRSEGALNMRGGSKEIGKAHVCADDYRLRFSFRVERGYNAYTGKYGNTIYTLWPDNYSFADIAKAMMEAHPDAAIKAFGAALSGGLPSRASEAA